MATETLILDMSDHGTRRDLMAKIGRIREGIWEFNIKQRYRGRTLKQNSCWWALVVPSFVAGAREEWGEELNSEEAHEILLDALQGEEKRHTNRETGEIISVRYVPTNKRSSKLDVAEFADLFDRACQLILEYFGIAVPIPGEYEDDE